MYMGWLKQMKRTFPCELYDLGAEMCKSSGKIWFVNFQERQIGNSLPVIELISESYYLEAC